MQERISSKEVKSYLAENNFEDCVSQISTLTHLLSVLTENMKSLVDDFPRELVAAFDLGIAVSVISAGTPDVVYIAGSSNIVRDALNAVEKQLQVVAIKGETYEDACVKRVGETNEEDE